MLVLLCSFLSVVSFLLIFLFLATSNDVEWLILPKRYS